MKTSANAHARPHPRLRRHSTLIKYPQRSLAVAGVLAVATTTMFLLVWSTRTRPAVQRVDDGFLRLMRDLRFGPLVTAAKVLAFIGGTATNWTVRAVVIVVLLTRRHWLHLAAFTLAVITSEALIGPMKALYARPRPPGSLIGTTGGSFPSGHAVAAVVTAVGLVIVLVPAGNYRWVWEFQAALYATLVALSRTYLYAHWLSDVVAGALLGATLAIGWPAALVYLRERAHPQLYEGSDP